eukprot:gene43297-57623_t
MIQKLTNELDKVPKTLADHMRFRDKALMDLSSDDARELLVRAEYWETVQTRLAELAASLNNCQPTLEKLAKQAAKDKATVREASKKAGTATFDTKHPIYKAQRAALDLAARKFEYPIADFQNLAAELIRNRSVQGVPELKKLSAMLNQSALEITEELTTISRNL